MSAFLLFSDIRVEVDNYHNDFLILRCDDSVFLSRLGKALFLQQFEFVDEVIATPAEVLLKLNGLFSPVQISRLAELEIPPEASATTFNLPVFFDHPSEQVETGWKAVLEHTGLSKSAVIETLLKGEYSVAMLGFLPGFAYLNGLAEELYVPRMAVPSKYVEAGSLAIGGKYLGLYAINSPGGWNVIGKTPLKVLQVPQLPPVPFLPGDKFCLHRIERAEYDELMAQPLTLSEYHART